MAISGRTHLHTRDTLIDPAPIFLMRTIFITCALTVAGSSWYIAVNMTTPSDLTAIYNCSAFFAYAFSVPLLKEQIRKVKVICVGVSIVGVLIVAYGDGGDSGEGVDGKSRLLGNLIIGVGSVLYGFYEVLYKKLGCPPEGTSPGRTMVFSNAIASAIGATTLVSLLGP
jgi:drug/metabolite transporter (DMT)-like permease